MATTFVDHDFSRSAHVTRYCEIRIAVNETCEIRHSKIAKTCDPVIMANDHAEQLRGWIEGKLEETGVSQTVLARHLGIAPSAVSRVIKGERQLSAAEFMSVARFFDASLADFDEIMGGYKIANELSAHDAKSGDQHSVLKPATSESATVVRPFFEGDEWLIPFEIARSIDLPPFDLRWALISNNVMSPTMDRGDVVVFDVSDTNPSTPGVFAIENGNEPIFRRVQMQGLALTADATLALTADNPRYGEQHVKAGAVRVLGRCVALLSSNHL